jgi:calcineurin-like phosphoesterase
MRLLFLGDMVGKTGRTAVWEKLPDLIDGFRLDFVIVNGENAAGGFGITEEIFRETINAGADVLATNEGGRTARMMANDKFYVDVINLLTEAERQLGVSEDGSCSSTRSVVKPQVVNLMKPTTH